MSAEDDIGCKDTETNGNTARAGEMQTVVSSYVAPNLIGQADRLIDATYPNDSTLNIEYQYSIDRSPEAKEERINVEDDCDEKDEELVIADDDFPKSQNEETTDSIDCSMQNEVNEDRGKNYEKEENFELSWHPHVYGKPPKMPTPHTIEYILGLPNKNSERAHVSKDERSTVSQLINVKRNFDNKKNYHHEKSTQVQRDLAERKFNISVHKNKLQEQLLQRSVRTSESEYDKVHYISKDDQPLNLSVPKSKDSPGWSSVDEDKAVKDPSKLIKRKKSTDDVRSPLGGEGSMTSEEGEEPGAGRRKKARTTFTGRQIFELEKLFEVKKYLSSGERADMAKLLNVTETQKRDPESQLLSPVDPSCKSRKIWWRLAIDVPILLVVATLVILFEFDMIPQYKSGFFCNDPALSFPYTGDTVSNEFIIISFLLFPIVLMLVTEYIFLDTAHPFITKLDLAFRKSIVLYRSYAYGLFVNFALIEVMKGITGSPRPTFFYICEPDTAKTCNGTEFVSTFQCTSTKFSKWFQNDSFHSFPSGHTSLSVYCGLFMAWYLQRRAFDWRHRTVFTVPLLQMLCFTYTAVSSLTRITDRRHHWWDVLTGAFIGLACVFYVIAVLCNNFTPKSARGPVDPSITVSQQSVRTLVSDGRQSVLVA